MSKLKWMMVAVLKVDGILSPRNQATTSDDFIFKRLLDIVGTVAQVKRKERK